MAIARGNNNGEAEKTTLLDTKFYVATFVSVLGTMFQSETLIFLSQKEIKMTNQSTTGDIRGLSRKVVTAVIVFVLAIVIFASTAFAQMASNYNVQIDVDNNTYSITTNETEPIEILSQANIALNDTDKLDISSFNAGKGGVIKIDRLNDVNVEFNGTIEAHSSATGIIESTVNENDAVWAVRIISNEDTDILDALKKKDMAADYYDNAVIAKSTEYGSYLGKFKLTAYCSCPICCGVWSGGPTASGAMPTIDHTVAMAGLPFGTELIINGQVYTVEDLGTPYGHVDIYMNNHQAALQFGVQYSDVYLKK